MKGVRGDLRRPEAEGGRTRAAEARSRGRPEEREGERPYGNREESCERGERSGAGRGDFLVLF